MLRLLTTTVAALIAEASASPDREVCGLVWASADWPGDGAVEHVRPLRNVHPDPAKYYRVSTSDLREAYREMDDLDGEPVAWYHSHPSGKSDPSETDMQGAMDPGMHYLILYPEFEELKASLGQVIGRVSHWQVSAWECLEPGLLLQADFEVVS